MLRFALPFAVSLATAAMFPVPAMAAEIEIEADGPVVELVITETVESDPDGVTLTAGVSNVSDTATQASQITNVQMRAVLDALDDLGIDAENVETQAVTLSPRFQWNAETQMQVFAGYVASNSVTVKLDQIERTGLVLDALIAAGATTIGQLRWTIDDTKAKRTQARAAALVTGRERAMEYAAATGYDEIALLQISETDDVFGYGFAVAEAVMISEAMGTSVIPAKVSTSVTLAMSFELVGDDEGEEDDD